MSAGTLNVNNLELIGQKGMGTLNQAGGSNTAFQMLLGDTGGAGTVLLSGGTLTLTGDDSLNVGNNGNGFLQLSSNARLSAQSIYAAYDPNTTGTIAVNSGTLTAVNITLGDDQNTSGNMIQRGGTVTISTNLALGQFGTTAKGNYSLVDGTLTTHGEYVGVTGSGTFTQSGGLNSTFFLVLGDGTGSAGTVVLSGGSLTIQTSLTYNAASQFIQTGGALTVGAFNGPTPVPYTFTGGLLHLTSQALLIGSTGLLGSNVSTSPTKSIIVDGATTLNPLSLLSINGGTFSTGAFLNSGGSVSLNSGTLGLTNSPLTIGTNQPLGATVKLEFGANIAIAGANNLTVDPLAELQLDGGAVYAGGVTNNGNIVFSAPTSLISGGTLTNNGLISGTGRVASVLSSSSTGEVRVDPNDSIQFQLAGNGSNGKFTLNGGRIEFTHDLTLFSSATVFGRGTLIANGGLANFGTMIFSGAGNSDVFGNVTNINRITVTGGNTTTFWNNVTTSSGEMSVNTNSTAVFVGTLTGQSFITGPGVKDYEGTASGGAIATIVGDTIVESSANVSADLVHEDDVQVYGALQVTPNGSPAHLSQINTLSIPSGKFDLSNNDLITTGTPIASVASDIASAYNHGDWQGAGLTSSTAAGIAADASNPHKTALGYATASSLGISTFDGQPVSGSTVLVHYTYAGDANLDGKVNALDFNALATNFGQNAGSDVWTQGDFNYDGVVNTQDFTALASNFNQVLASPSLGTLVPEPASLALVVAIWAIGRRRRGDI